jgi:hypothetical protein
MTSLKAKLDVIRRFTGNKFSAANGYDLRKPLSKRRVKTIERYYQEVMRLTSRDYQTFVPKKGWKKEAFEFTGQRGFNYFQKAIIQKPDPEANYTFELDKSRPKGSRFIMYDRKRGEKIWHIPASAFWEIEDDEIYGDPDELSAFYSDVLDEYAEEAEIYMIQNGDYHMWGSAGGRDKVAQKIADLMKQYGSDNFDPNDKHSHHIDNWFSGVTAYARVEDVWPYITERSAAFIERNRERGTDGRLKARILRNGNFGAFIDGRLEYQVSPVGAAPVTPRGQKRKHRRKSAKPKRR